MSKTKEPLLEELPPKKSPDHILKEEVREGLDALDRSFTRLFISAISAGLELSLSLLLIAVVRTNLGDQFPKAVSELLLANMYSFGFIVVVLGRSELFTEQTTLAILPLRAGRTDVHQSGPIVGHRLRRQHPGRHSVRVVDRHCGAGIESRGRVGIWPELPARLSTSQAGSLCSAVSWPGG